MKLTVCHIIGSLRVGGAERQVINTVNHLRAPHKHLLLLSAPADHGLIQNVDPGSTTVHHIPVRQRSLPLNVLQIARLLKREKIDVVHTHMFWPNVYGVLGAALARVPVVFTSEHGMNVWKKRRHKWFERRVLSRLADVRICVSSDILQQRQIQDGVPENRLRVLPNGTAVGPARSVRPGDAPLRLVAVGRLIDVKGYPILIEAAELLVRRGIDLRLDILGDGERRDTLQAAITARQLADCVTLQGNVNDPERWLREAGIFVMSSYREGQPMALLEAMAASMPIVASAVGGIPDTVTDGEEALLVPAGDAAALASAIQRLHDDPEFAQRLGGKAHERVLRDYSIQAVCRKLEDMYQATYEAKRDVA